MAVNEQIVIGKKFRVCIDVVNKVWQRISFWTKASDVEFDDGKTAQEKLGAINGITSALNSSDSTLALSASAGQALDTKITTISNTNISTGNTITNLSNQLNGLYLRTLTQAEYDAIPQKDANTLYFIKE